MQQTNLPSFSIRTTMNSFGAPTIALLNHIGSATLLPSEFTPGNWDVVCIRGKDCPKHGEQTDGLDNRSIRPL